MGCKGSKSATKPEEQKATGTLLKEPTAEGKSAIIDELAEGAAPTQTADDTSAEAAPKAAESAVAEETVQASTNAISTKAEETNTATSQEVSAVAPDAGTKNVDENVVPTQTSDTQIPNPEVAQDSSVVNASSTEQSPSSEPLLPVAEKAAAEESTSALIQAEEVTIGKPVAAETEVEKKDGKWIGFCSGSNFCGAMEAQSEIVVQKD